MKATGIVRRIDDLGRICLPKEIRDHRGIMDGDPLEVFVDEDGIYLRPYRPGCAVPGCTETDATELAPGFALCRHHAGKALEVWEAAGKGVGA